MSDRLKRIWFLYYDGFRNMTIGRSLWLIIILKIFFLFAILRVFFFNDYLGEIGNDNMKGDYVGNELIERCMSNINKTSHRQ
jgi:hypothetical protein